VRTKILKKAFRYRLVLTAAQDERLRFMAGCRRFIYNWGLARRSSFYKENLRSIPKKQLSAELTTLKADPDKLWLKDADSQTLQQALVDLDRAFASFFEKRACYPKFKNKKTDPLRFRIPQRVKVRGSEVYCPKAGWIRFRKSHEVEGKVKSATFKRDVCGKWYVTLVCHI
jgi:putative transposase